MKRTLKYIDQIGPQLSEAQFQLLLQRSRASEIDWATRLILAYADNPGDDLDDRPNAYWLKRLIEYQERLILAIRPGDGSVDPLTEWLGRIGGLCVRWLRKRRGQVPEW